MFDKPTLKMFLDLKKAFDPKQRLNDAKLIPSDKMKIELHKTNLTTNTPGGAL